MRCARTHSLTLLAAFVLFRTSSLSGTIPAAASWSDGVEFFEKQIRPLLIERCYECHDSRAKKTKGGLALESREALRKGGDSGPVLVPGDPGKSLLMKAVRYADKDLQMPPSHKLEPEQIAALEKWIKMGAPDPRSNSPPSPAFSSSTQSHWAFQPPRDSPAPPIANRRWPKNPIDHFILARLEREGLRPNPAADKRTLIRRATFDLTGLPPTPEEVQGFLNDHSPQAFERVLDRLLASPQYGERWGRYWLDVVHYADTAGESADYPIPQAYQYRNYVIRSFNRDKPYDEFVREQIAGDLLPSGSKAQKDEQIIATGFIAISRRFSVEPDNAMHLTIEDTLDTMGRSILGLSLSCARCHDHKYDPISTQDYYSLYGIFSSTRYPYPGSEVKKKQRDFVVLTPAAEADALLKPFNERLAMLDAEVKRLDDKLKMLRKEGIQADDVSEAFTAAIVKRDDFAAAAPPIERAYAVSEGKPANAKIQKRGEPDKLGEEVPRQFLKVLGGQKLPGEEKGSGRLQLAQWLTDPANPLTARVMVNRVWQHHFGNGIVETASDFGTRGKPPSHPELLDYLTVRFIRSGWSVKALHKLIMLSQTYQQSAADEAVCLETDPNDELLWKFQRRRLDAEAIRDTLLVLSGELEWSAGGPHPFPSEVYWNYTQHNPFAVVYDTRRRSVYLMQQRIKRHPFLALFDGADPNSSTAGRAITITPLQALFSLNDAFVHAQAERFAARLCRERSKDRARIELAYQLALARRPEPEEIREAAAYLEKFRATLEAANTPAEKRSLLAWASFARALLGSNELLFVD